MIERRHNHVMRAIFDRIVERMNPELAARVKTLAAEVAAKRAALEALQETQRRLEAEVAAEWRAIEFGMEVLAASRMTLRPDDKVSLAPRSVAAVIGEGRLE